MQAGGSETIRVYRNEDIRADSGEPKENLL